MEAARLRFRPVLMTAISFVFGTLPLLVASGPAAASRQAAGERYFGAGANSAARETAASIEA